MECHTNHIKKTGCSLCNVCCLLHAVPNFHEHKRGTKKKTYTCQIHKSWQQDNTIFYLQSIESLVDLNYEAVGGTKF